ncbi:MAG: exodeoxyribonuclease VII large subunit [Epulopiscium sp.]|nr:exodeoxyribonuclease VII large subunit [Candidatus Epulonipiscium sp.]
MTNKKIFSVSHINSYIKSLIDMDYILNNIAVQGEISNFKKHTSGHMYFTLKDKNSSISCIMFRSSASTLQFEPENGIGVIIRGSISVYEKTGQYQIYVNKMEKEGRGALYEAYENLKNKLQKEGLFGDENKKPLPNFPKSIGIITSPTGAALRDIIQVSKRRNPNIPLIIYPVLVQGIEAPKSIWDGIHAMNEYAKVDVIILGRGGGSIEDLWAFNDEAVARAISNSKIPIISAVGHEIDFTIADFAADLRAPTPSAAAELAVPLLSEFQLKVESSNKSLTALIKEKINLGTHRLIHIQKRTPFKRPLEIIYKNQQSLDSLEKLLIKQIQYKLDKNKSHLSNAMKTLEALSPLNILLRGYSITTDDKGCNISSIKDVKISDTLNIYVKDGFIKSCVKAIKNKEEGLNG